MQQLRSKKLGQLIPILHKIKTASPHAGVSNVARSEAWLAFLRMNLPQDIYKKVLIKIHTSLIPNITDPLLLSDFLTASLDEGGKPEAISSQLTPHAKAPAMPQTKNKTIISSSSDTTKQLF
eukprot:scaffold227233_cov33-Prasinocladus_malaysianus.AAC.1